MSAGPDPKVDDANERILRERAAQLALEDIAGMAGGGTQLQALRFRLGAEQYAVELHHLREIQRAAGLTPVPCTPPHISGVLNVRGEIIPVLDLAVALGLPAAGMMDASQDAQVVLAERRGGMRVGLLVSEVLGVEWIAADRLDRSFRTSSYAAGIADGRTVLLDLARLLADAHFEVLDDVD